MGDSLMLSNFFEAVLILAAIAAVGGLVNSLSERLPRRFKRTERAYPSDDFGVWGNLENFWFEEFRVGFVDEWEIGPIVSAVAAPAEVKLGDEVREGDRVTFHFRGYRDACLETDVIGWGTVSDKGATINFSFPPETVGSLLNEFRQSTALHLHAHGWVKDGKIKVTHFNLMPRLD
jgi:hypothetical protein